MVVQVRRRVQILDPAELVEHRQGLADLLGCHLGTYLGDGLDQVAHLARTLGRQFEQCPHVPVRIVQFHPLAWIDADYEAPVASRAVQGLQPWPDHLCSYRDGDKGRASAG